MSRGQKFYFCPANAFCKSWLCVHKWIACCAIRNSLCLLLFIIICEFIFAGHWICIRHYWLSGYWAVDGITSGRIEIHWNAEWAVGLLCGTGDWLFDRKTGRVPCCLRTGIAACDRRHGECSSELLAITRIGWCDIWRSRRHRWLSRVSPSGNVKTLLQICGASRERCADSYAYREGRSLGHLWPTWCRLHRFAGQFVASQSQRCKYSETIHTSETAIGVSRRDQRTQCCRCIEKCQTATCYHWKGSRLRTSRKHYSTTDRTQQFAGAGNPDGQRSCAWHCSAQRCSG